MQGVPQVTMAPGYSLGPEQVGQLRSLPQSVNSSGATQPAPAAYLRYGFSKVLTHLLLTAASLLCPEAACSWRVCRDA